MNFDALEAISPVDGRYQSKTAMLQPYFSEYALIKYRVYIEIQYFIALAALPELNISLSPTEISDFEGIHRNFTIEDAKTIKEIEATTNHDVKAVEYFIKDKMDELDMASYKEWIHFGLTSQDVNNTAMPLMLKDALNNVYLPLLHEIVSILESQSEQYADIAMLAKTHGQPASPSTLGKEFKVFVSRLDRQIAHLESLQYTGKFGGATGNFNAHKLTFPSVNWKQFGTAFLNKIGLERLEYTTQISHYDQEADTFHTLSRIHTILIDFSRDIWLYISMEYFKQKVLANEVGSSAMPHKVNPIDFENAEGNLLYGNSILEFLARKLPISRLQRDLTDSTVMRNIGVPIAHAVIALTSLKKGISKLEINQAAIDRDLNANWAVVAEAIQNILRREGVDNPYEKLKVLTRGNNQVTKETMQNFINTLEVDEDVKKTLLGITPFNYVGYTLHDA